MNAFPEAGTEEGAFALLDGTQVAVPMMNQLAPLGYSECPSMQVVDLPYVGGELSMVVLVPEAGNFESSAEGLDVGALDACLSGLGPAK
jgi:serpin B